MPRPPRPPVRKNVAGSTCPQQFVASIPAGTPSLLRSLERKAGLASPRDAHPARLGTGTPSTATTLLLYHAPSRTANEPPRPPSALANRANASRGDDGNALSPCRQAAARSTPTSTPAPSLNATRTMPATTPPPSIPGRSMQRPSPTSLLSTRSAPLVTTHTAGPPSRARVPSSLPPKTCSRRRTPLPTPSGPGASPPLERAAQRQTKPSHPIPSPAPSQGPRTTPASPTRSPG